MGPDEPFLPPTNDLVFKILFERNLDLLTSMLCAVLDETIEVEEVLNPGLPGEDVGDKRMQLDLRVRLADGRRAFVEMQAVHFPHLASRFLAYLCRDYSAQLSQGELYDALTPTIGIVWLVGAPQPKFGFHEIFWMFGERTREVYSDALTLHVLQIGLAARVPAMEPGAAGKVLRWARLLAVRSRQDFEELRTMEPSMKEALERLRMLSAEPEMVRRARERAEAEYFYQLGLREAKKLAAEEGRAEGLAEGKAEGRAEGLAEGKAEGRAEGLAEGKAEGKAEGLVEGKAEGKATFLERVLEKRFGALPGRVATRLRSASEPELDAWLDRALEAMTIEEVFGQ